VGDNVARRFPLLTLVAAAPLMGGCGLGAGETPTGVRLDITRDFGAQVLRSLPAPRVHGQETVMSLLLRNTAVKTTAGGDFVESIDGHSAGHEANEPIDWFYYVNGVQVDEGAAETNVDRGNHVWWDMHDWSQTEDVPAVVGSFPEPFLDGVEGRRLPVRVECARPADDPCRAVSARLSAAGVRSSATSLGGAPSAHEALRVLVGTWAEVRRDPGAQTLERGPRVSGVYARVPARGGAIAVLNAQGQVTHTLTGSAGLIAATRSNGEPPEWVITGTDAAGLDRAVHALDESTLRDRFAVALTGSGGVLALPQPSP
jgi:Domain of unknown function (DUF4430)